MTLPYNTAGNKVPLQLGLAEVLDETGQLIGLGSPPSRVPTYMAATHTQELERELKWRNMQMELYTS